MHTDEYDTTQLVRNDSVGEYLQQDVTPDGVTHTNYTKQCSGFLT